MTLKNFIKQLNETNEVKLIIKFRRPFISHIFIEKYLFKKCENNIESYEDGEKKFETTSIIHMYFIYKKALTFDNLKRKDIIKKV